MGSKRFSHFTNDGFGWFCVRCRGKGSDRETTDVPSSLFLEGEAEKTGIAISLGRAVWSRSGERTLQCPNCGNEEVEFSNDKDVKDENS